MTVILYILAMGPLAATGIYNPQIPIHSVKVGVDTIMYGNADRHTVVDSLK